MRILNLPLPIFAAALAQPIETPAISAPAWVNSFLLGVFVLGYFLNLAGKLPFTSPERRAHNFDDAARRKLDEMHAIVMAEDDTKPRWRRVWSPTSETLETLGLVRELADMRLAWEAERAEVAAEREEWRMERAEWAVARADFLRRITELEKVNRLQEHALKHGGGG